MSPPKRDSLLHRDDSPASVTLWRCVECGHWSHAKRRPISHPRSIQNIHDEDVNETLPLPDGRRFHDAAQEAADLELPVVRVFEAHTTQTAVDDFEFNPGGVKIKCGPFEEYRAKRVRPWNEDPQAKAHAARLSAEGADDGRHIENAWVPHAERLDDPEFPF